MRYLPFFVVASCSLLAGCGATLSPAAAKIQVHTQISTALDNCKKLGPVMVTYTKKPFVNSEPFLFAALREETAKLGGDSVALLQRDDVSGEAIRHGIAYKCYP